MFKVFKGNSIYWVSCFNDLVYSIENLITGCLTKASLVVEVEEIMDACEESLGIEAQQFGVSTYVMVPRDRGLK
jgi:hypothetical protein